MRSKVPREGPAWVDEFLSGDYFTSCDFHTGGKNERNQFCTECSGSGPLCQFGLLASHSGHRTLQVRKASHMDSIRVVDIQQCLEVSDIQTYSINSAKIVFLLSRPQPRPSKGALHACLCCNRALSDDVKFCSLACKLDVLREQPEDRSITFALPADGEEENGSGCFKRKNSEAFQDSPTTPEKFESISTAKARCRKGVPRRAPMG
ncbi:hypothetical protein SELMODRAFT_102589 [Selaginella moellendorffii]|uniref:PLATZ transcription factor family protein n=1 Tax=Selaginella moellendorffii TaxID=88036 RepID=D8RV57_SELML|nr:hypothetical protein SELMODRAFT_102589 [Selaginella moellendorffii]